MPEIPALELIVMILLLQAAGFAVACRVFWLFDPTAKRAKKIVAIQVAVVALCVTPLNAGLAIIGVVIALVCGVSMWVTSCLTDPRGVYDR
jgi:hypothetical protein